ncbi:phospholipase A2 inhibitor and Ly6/PLAUR domain-containing protein-like [Pantherophis guttatus]|uniref:Phospholipase A2 inhibitor and Ly6/PLAUR domain-containing protein-like n=1 Tax=Pantherophis guttatus TaxID=94885 RepID=A0ABM3ZNR5_PANGU|nr:phospholipase A2 inhibitor and Ly6/PLAUR domain-containing protein-like [Pantherophis guttatus]
MQEKFLDIPSHGGITKPVQSLLQIFLFFEFLKTVTTLKCEVCSDIGTNCTGNLKTCEAEQETCVVILIHSTLGSRTMQTVAKGCESIVVCNSPKTHLNMGNGKILQGSLVCCADKACRTAIPSLPSVQTDANGRQCPACFSDTGTCEKELTNCTGNEHYCFHLFMRSYGDGVLWDSIMEGCTTKATCNHINHGHMSLLQRRNTVIITSRCSQCDLGNEGAG